MKNIENECVLSCIVAMVKHNQIKNKIKGINPTVLT